ncbi:MAG: hypothetical protein GX638_10680 [Crenarchaeota archaeon]|nr:hypothetical protein [Thermoproteota archaeon]
MSEYNFLETKGKTQKVNNLQAMPDVYSTKYNKNFLFDFSLLGKHITDKKLLEEIKNICFKNCSGITSRYIPIFKDCDIFRCFDYYTGNLYFKPYSIYSNEKNKRVYVIMRLVKIENLRIMERHYIYDEFKIEQEINDQIGYDAEIEDINIA